MSACAVIHKDSIEVVNTILADTDFPIDGFYLVEYDSDKFFCQKGIFYNATDAHFYDDSIYSTINGVVTSVVSSGYLSTGV